jgi:hypothetical protein
MSLPRLLPRGITGLSPDTVQPARPGHALGIVTDTPGETSTETTQSPSLSTSRSNDIASPSSTRQTETPSQGPGTRLVRYRATDNPNVEEEGESERISAAESMVMFAGESVF